MPPRPVTTLQNRWPYYALAAVALLLSFGGAQRQTHVSALPEALELRPSSFPVTVDGKVAGSMEELEFVVQAYPPRSTLELTTQHGPLEVVTVSAVSRFYLVITILNGLFFWVVSVLVFAPRMDRTPAPHLFWACILYGSSVMVGAIYYPMGNPWSGSTFAVLRIVSLVLLPTLLLHVSLSFPQRRTVLDRYPQLMLSVYVLGLALAAWHAAALLVYVLAPSPDHWRLLHPPDLAGKLFLVLVFSAGCVTFIDSQQRAEQEREREQAKWIIWGIAFGAAPFIFLRTLPGVWGETHVLPPEIARLFSIVIPVAFSFAVIRYKFLEIDIIIRRSLIYPLVAAVMVGLYLLLGGLIGREIERTNPQWSEFITIGATLIPLSLFVPTRRVIAHWVDRRFFKISYNYNQALAAYRETVANATTQSELARSLQEFLQRTLQVKQVGVILRRRDRSFAAGEIDSVLTDLAMGSLTPFVRKNGSFFAANRTTSIAERERDDLPPAFLEGGFRVFQPLVADHRLLGLALLGEKTNERRYIEQDLRLLENSAEVTASVLDRMNLAQDVAEEAIARSQANEMIRYKTSFFSHVAHDLRSPLTSISWSARNLVDGVVGELSDAQKEYLRGIEGSANQLVRLVNNLLEITRLETSSPELELHPVALADVAREAVGRLEPISAPQRIRFTLRLDPSLPPIAGSREKLLEVVDNLVENAVRYSPPGSTVEVSLSRTDGVQRLCVRDHGPGIAGDDLPSIWQSFRQGKPSPYSTQMGFGLGLHVVKTYVELMHGSVSVTNHPDGGAQFECAFPEASLEEKPQ